MKAYIQGEEKLIPLQEEVTANSIKKSLGYTPADEEDFKDISTTDDTAFYIVDKNQNIIAKIDAEGVKAAVMTVNGKDVESGLIPDDVISVVDDSALCVTDKNGNVITRTDGEGFKAIDVYVGEDQKSVTEHLNDSSKHIGNEIELTDDKAFYITDNQGNILFKVDGNGVHAAEVYVGDETVAALIENAYAALVDSAPDTLNTLNELAVAIKEHHDVTDVLDEAITKKANDSDLKEHTDNSNLHLGDEIALDDKEHLYITDSQGNIIARFDGDGLDVTDLKIGSIHFSEHIQEIASGGSVCSHEYEKASELVRNTTDCTSWRDLLYCKLCGKTHAEKVYNSHEYGDWYTSLEPTCTETGIKRRKCNRCECFEKGVEDVDPLGHDMITVPEQLPTTSAVGWKEYQKCSRCEYVEGDIVPIYRVNVTIDKDVSNGRTVAIMDSLSNLYISEGETKSYLITAAKYSDVSDSRYSLGFEVTNADKTVTRDSENDGTYTLTISNPTDVVNVSIIGHILLD